MLLRIAALLPGLVAACGCSSDAPRAAPLTTDAVYQNDVVGVRMAIPDGWHMTARTDPPSGPLPKPIVLVSYSQSKVEKPGQFELRGRISLLEALAMAGGVKRSAKHTQVLIFRRFDEDHVVTRVVDAKRLAKAGRVQEDPYLRPGDLIFVPQNKFSKVERLVPLASIGWLLGWVW